MSFNVGENVGPYRIIEQLGQGGMATVFKAYHASLDRYVAIKALHPAFNQDPSFEARFQREARVVAKLEHPNIVPVYDYAEHEKRPYLVMKFIEGETLKAKLDKGPLSREEVASIVEAVGSALAYAHRQNVLHRDIKPSNVLVTPEGQIYLADFGLARIAQSGESTLSSDMIMGTPQYISPEQAMGIKELDARTDIYSFGVMVYEMVVGKVPYNADTPFSVIHDHIYTPLPLPRKVNPDVSEPVERVLLKALAKNRLDRYDDVTQMVSAFGEAWNQVGTPVQISSVMDAAASQMVPPAEQKKAAVPLEPMAAMPKPVSRSDKTSGEKRSPWVWVGAGVIFLVCLVFTAHAVRNRLFAPLFRNAREATSVPTLSQPTSQPTEAPLPVSTSAPEEQIPLGVAQARAKEDPSDLDAQLNLALAYWDANMPVLAYETLVKVSKLAGSDNALFYTKAGERFASRQAWPPAAILYFQAVKYYRANEGAPPELVFAFHEAMYRAADRPNAARVMPIDNIADVDRPIALIAGARHAFYTKDYDKAYALLNEVKTFDPNIPAVTLLEAEFKAREGKPDEARQLITALTKEVTTPMWVRKFAEEILERLP